MNTAISSAYMNCCGMSGTCGIDRNHIDPFNTGRRCVPFRAEKRLPRCTRAHALRWQITPCWGCRIRNCGGCVSASGPSMRPLQGRETAAPLYQGSRPSLADYAPLGLSDSEFQRTSHASIAMSLAPFNRIAAMPRSLASLYVHLVSSTTVRHPFLADRPIRSQAADSDASSPNGA